MMKTIYSYLLITILLLALQGHSQTVKVYFNNGNEKIKQADFTGAIADFTRAININPKYGDAYYNRGIVKAEILEYVPNSVLSRTIVKKLTGNIVVSSLDSGEGFSA
jgi:tetratricopeptide (TPR) repeat protein